MDPHSILIGLVVCVLSAIIIYVITAFTMKEKTFDEVLEEQRRRQEEEKPKSKKKVDVAKKKVKKEVVREKTEKPKTKVESTTSKKEKEHKMVNLEIEPEIIEPEESQAIHAKKNKKNKTQKPILVNKNEQPLVSEATKEIHHREQTPRDELALKHKQDDEKVVRIEDTNKSKKKSDTKKERSAKNETVTEIPQVHVEVEKPLKSEKKGDLNKEKSKVKSIEKIKNVQESNTGTGSPIINSVKNATLNDTDIQSLIEVLLNKQGGSIDVNSEWNKKSQRGQKGDNLSLLKQQLEEKERALQQEQQLAMSSNNKVKEIRQDLNTEKAKYVSLEKAYKDKLEAQNNEMAALQNRIAHTHEQHAAEMNNLQARLRQVEQSADRGLLQKLSEENKILQDTLSNMTKNKTDAVSQSELANMRQKASIMEKELDNNAVKLNASENSRKVLEVKVVKYEEEIRNFESGHKDTEAVLTKKLEEVNKELRRADTRNNTLNNDYKKATADLQKANGALKSAEGECYSLKKQLQELNKHLSSADATKELEGKLQQASRKSSELEGNVKNLEKQLSDSNRQYLELQKEIEVMQHENMALVEEMKTTKERQAGEGQEAAPNVPSGAPNGHIHKETPEDKNMIKLEEHEAILSERVKEVTRLMSELANQKSEVNKLQEQLESQKKKNNELREKNWKAMEALEKTEKSLSEKVDSAIKNTREKTTTLTREMEGLDKGVLQRLFPSVSVSDKLVHKEWISSFEKQANTYIVNLSQKSSNSANQESKIKHLEDTNKKLSTQTRDLQKIIDDTENKLKQLQKSVETEEKKWKDKLGKAMSSQSTESSSQVKDLEAQVTEYRSVLSSTEDRLLQFSEKVESEEKLWKVRLQSTETQLETTKKELCDTKEELKKSKGSTEMEVKVDILEKDLRHSDEEKNQLYNEVEEAKSQVIILEKQIETSSQISIENEEYRRLYEAEKKKTKELSTNVVKLNGIIKTGQDALSQEQKLVNQLQDQIDTSSSSGKSISAAASPVKDNGTSV